MEFDQDLCLNLQYDFDKMNSTLGSVVPLAMFFILQLDLTFTTLDLGLIPDVCLFLLLLKIQGAYFHPVIGIIEARTLKMVILIYVFAQKCI